MQRVWNLVLALVVSATGVAQLALLVSGGQDENTATAAAPVPLATKLLRFFSYFTVQSNLLVLAAAISLVIRPDRDVPGPTAGSPPTSTPSVRRPRPSRPRAGGCWPSSVGSSWRTSRRPSA